MAYFPKEQNNPITNMVAELNRLLKGYADGISFDNIKEKVDFLESSPIVRNYWIDMESSVRTDDKFDIAKVMACIFKLYADTIVIFN